MSERKYSELKALKKRLKQLEGEIAVEKQQLTQLNERYSTRLKQKREVEEKIRNLEKKSELSVSEHAVLRYLDRVKGINIKDITHEIINTQILDLYNTLDGNDGTYPSGTGYSVVIKNGIITTIIS